MQELKVNSSAQLSLFDQERNYIPSSPIGILVVDKKPQLPLSAQTKGDELLVNYPCGECKFKIEKKKGYHKITITSEYGSASADFTVESASNTAVIVIIIVVAVVVVGVVAVVVILKKKELI